VTEWKLNMVEHGMSASESYLVELMHQRVGVFADGVIGGPFHRVYDLLGPLLPVGLKVPPAALLHAFKEAGWIDMGRIGSKEYSSKKHVFAAPDALQKHSKSELRRMVENTSNNSAMPKIGKN
jgi:hypothetical protein